MNDAKDVGAGQGKEQCQMVRQNPQHGRPGGGFTLVELLVVISIIAVLVALLLPGLSRARDSSKNTRCSVSTRQMTIASLNFATDSRLYLPHAYFYNYWGTGGINQGNNIAGYGDWDTNRETTLADTRRLGNTKGASLLRYMNVRTTTSFITIGSFSMTTRIAQCPGVDTRGNGIYYPSYGMNVIITNNSGVAATARQLRIEDIKRSSALILLGERFHEFEKASGAQAGMYGSLWHHFYTTSEVLETRFRHLELVNYAYIDGHVESRPRYWLWSFNYGTPMPQPANSIRADIAPSPLLNN